MKERKYKYMLHEYNRAYATLTGEILTDDEFQQEIMTAFTEFAKKQVAEGKIKEWLKLDEITNIMLDFFKEEYIRRYKEGRLSKFNDILEK